MSKSAQCFRLGVALRHVPSADNGSECGRTLALSVDMPRERLVCRVQTNRFSWARTQSGRVNSRVALRRLRELEERRVDQCVILLPDATSHHTKR